MSRVWLAVGSASALLACSALIDLTDLRSDASASDASDASSGLFVDDFNRADDASIGNGWIEKNPNDWILSDGAVLRTPTTQNYFDNVVYRPSSEDVADVAVSIEFAPNIAPPGFPQVHARIRSSTVGTPGNLDAYILAIDGTTQGARMDRSHGGAIGVLTTFNLSSALVVGDRYRLRLSVAHVPPTLTGTVEHWDATSSAWQTIGTGATLDASDASIDTPGSVGFAGGYQDVDAAYAYDNFTRQSL